MGKTAFAICCAVNAMLPLHAGGLGGEVVIITGHHTHNDRLAALRARCMETRAERNPAARPVEMVR